MNKPLFVFAAAVWLAGCAGDNPGSSVVIGPAARPNAQSTGVTAQAASTGATQVAAPSSGAPGAAAAGIVSNAATSAPPGPALLPSPVASAAPSTAPSTALAAAFGTRHAFYQPARFADLPGWSSDDLGGSLDAFRRGCGVVGARSGWATPCTAARSVDANNPTAIRRFFETYFDLYQITSAERSPDGTMTGYYEPLLNGSKQYGGAYVYPVYGVPEDMLYLDARRLNGKARGSVTAARIEGRAVIALQDAPPAAPSGVKGVYALDLRDSVPDIRDKKIRLRLDGNRIVPYYTRAEIERGAARAPVLAWVDDPVMLYSMQMQGSGKIRMRDGTIRRFAYAEQNGRPFLPPIAHAGQTGGHRLIVRGLDVDIDVTDDDNPITLADANGAHPSDNGGGPTPSASSNDNEDDQPVSPLLRGFKLAAATPSSTGSAGPATASAPRPANKSATAAATGGASSSPGADIATALGAGAPVKHSFATSDPSYVFFRPIPDSPNGPTGALGVPLSAGRSVAVDPRTTPLGSPVFVATRDDPQTPGAVNRLMMAQDSGGAIQGAVRADYFYGFGQAAQSAASRTKEHLRMWLLLPKGLHVAAQETATKTRGMAAPATADCLVADSQFCVDDSSP